MVVHTKVKPYACADCDGTFTQLESLKLHQRRHCPAKKTPTVIGNGVAVPLPLVWEPLGPDDI